MGSPHVGASNTDEVYKFRDFCQISRLAAALVYSHISRSAADAAAAATKGVTDVSSP